MEKPTAVTAWQEAPGAAAGAGDAGLVSDPACFTQRPGSTWDLGLLHTVNMCEIQVSSGPSKRMQTLSFILHRRMTVQRKRKQVVQYA